MQFDLAQWPPALSPDQIEALTLEANTFALAHGLAYLPIKSDSAIPGATIHAPYTLLPTPIPRVVFENAQAIQHAYNILYARIASDVVLLDRVMGAEQGVGRVDEFTGNLWRGWKDLREHGTVQPLQLGLFRSDYLMHASESLSFKQVEFNTISVSFGALSTLVSSMHQHLYDVTKYFDASSSLTPSNFPSNDTLASLAEGLAQAHKAYGVSKSCILMVVQDGERNVFDQRLIEYELQKKHSIRLVRLTFDQVAANHTVSSNHTLHITHPTSTIPLEVSVVYYRAGYTPTDYPTPTHYNTRFTLERTRAIKCPSIPLQLAGGKKIQEYITQPGILESLLPSSPPSELALLRSTWVPMWGLDEPNGVERARSAHLNLVLKPQREGGGNNVYRSNIPAFLDTLPEREREAWIAMEMIYPPDARNLLIKAGESDATEKEVVSELGIFGWALFGAQGDEIKEKNAGWLVRTKGKESDEGGVAVGFSVLDTILLVD